MGISTSKKKSVLESIRSSETQKVETPTGVRQAEETEDTRPFTRVNFYMMAGCIALIIIGFLLMSGGQSADPQAFNPEIFSTRRIVVGPVLAFLGFLLMAFAIIYTPKTKEKK